MPWGSGAAFASRHNKKLSGAPANTAKNQAEAMIKKGVPEGIAIATANKTGNRMARKSRSEKWYNKNH
jgi:hypothetical protein